MLHKPIISILLLTLSTLSYSQTVSTTKTSKLSTTSFTELVDTNGIHQPGSKFILINDTTYTVYTVRAVYHLHSGKIIYKTDKHKFIAADCDFLDTVTATKEYAFSIYRD